MHLAAATTFCNGIRCGAFSVFYGCRSLKNCAMKVRLSYTPNRAILVGLRYFLLAVESDRACVIYTDSEYLVHVVCHWVAANVSRGWKCAHADILQLIVNSIWQRQGAIQCRFSPPDDSSLQALKEAKRLALNAAASKNGFLFNPLDRVSKDSLVPCLNELETGSVHVPKVLTNLSRSRQPVGSSRSCPDADEIKADDSLSHRGRTRVRIAKRDNLKRLLEAETNADYWRVLQDFLNDFHHKSSPVSNLALSVVFKKRINPPEIIPDHFNTE